MSRRRRLAGQVRAHPLPTALAVDLPAALLLFSRALSKGDLVGSPGDPEAYVWTMRWGPYALTHGQPLLFTRSIIFPDGVNLIWNAPPITGVLLWPVTALLGAVAAYNVLAILGVTFSAWFAQIAIRRFVGGQAGPLAGGLLYGFSPYMTAHAAQHVGLVVAVLPPLLLLAFHELLVRRRRPAWQCGVAIGALLALQMLVFVETVVVAALTILLALAALAVLHPTMVRERLVPLLKAGVAAIATFVVLAAIPLWVMLRGDQRITGDVHPHGVFVIDLANLLIASPLQWLSSGPQSPPGWTGTSWEWDGYFGVPLLCVLLAVVVARRRDRAVRFAALMTVLLLLLSLGPTLHVGGHDTGVPLPGRVLSDLPLLSNLLPNRFMLFAYLFAALLLAHAPALLHHVPRQARAAVAGVVGLAVVATLTPRLPFAHHTLSAPAFFTSDTLHREVPQGSTMLVLPFAEGASTSAAMAWQAEADFWFRMPEGYAFVPGPDGPSQGAPVSPFITAARSVESGGAPPHLDSVLRAEFAAELARWQVRSIVIGPAVHEAAMVAMVTDITGHTPENTGGVALWSPGSLATGDSTAR